ncbi:MAG: hypothetical protein ACNA8W_15420 [Bradymonadaceae bacterium]
MSRTLRSFLVLFVTTACVASINMSSVYADCPYGTVEIHSYELNISPDLECLDVEVVVQGCDSVGFDVQNACESDIKLRQASPGCFQNSQTATVPCAWDTVNAGERRMLHPHYERVAPGENTTIVMDGGLDGEEFVVTVIFNAEYDEGSRGSCSAVPMNNPASSGIFALMMGLAFAGLGLRFGRR